MTRFSDLREIFSENNKCEILNTTLQSCFEFVKD